MAEYSKVKNIYIRNFRNIKDLKVSFERSPIVVLSGDNEAGKTSVVKAFSVAALHAFPREQKYYIRDGTNGFGVAIELVDGTVITRMKTSTINKYYIIYPDKTEWEIDKIDAGLPVQVSKEMGLIEEPETKEFLQVRTYENALLFVVTPASTNYKVMYDALKVDQLTRAIKLGSQEVNIIKADIYDKEVSMDTISENLRNIKIIDIEHVVNIRNRLSKQMDTLNKVERVKLIAEKINSAKRQLGALSVISEKNMQPIEMADVNKVNNIYRLLLSREKIVKVYERYKGINTFEKINQELYVKLGNLLDRVKSVSCMVDRYNKIKEVVNLDSIGVEQEQYIKMNNILSRIKGLSCKEEEYNKIKEVSTLSSIDIAQINKARRVKSLIDSLGRATRLYNIIDSREYDYIEHKSIDMIHTIAKIVELYRSNQSLMSERKKVIEYVEGVNKYLEQIGASVVECTKCGESIVIDINNIAKNRSTVE